VVAGDILISLQFNDLGVGSTPSGWTQLRNYTSDIESRLAWKVAGSSEPASYTFSQSTGGIGGGAIVIALQGASTSTPVSAVGSAGSGSTVTTPSVTPAGTDDLDIRFAVALDSSSFSPPAGFTERADVVRDDAGDTIAAACATRPLASGAATGTANFTASPSPFLRHGYTVTVSGVSGMDATAEPETVQAAASIPSPTVQADTGATATPDVVAATVTIPAPDVDDGTAPPEPPALVGSVTTAADRLATLTVAKPTGVQAGDLLIAHQTSDVSDLAELTTPTGGATWQLLDQFEEAGALQVKVWWKIAGESEPSSWNFSQESFADGAVLIAAVRNAADDTPTVANTSTTSTTSVPTPGITPPSPTSVEIRIASGNSAGNTVSWTPPAGLEEKADVQSTNYVAATLATRYLDSTTPTGTENFTASAALEFAAGFTIGIAGAGPSTVDATATPVVVEGSATIPAPTVSAGATATATPVQT